jgi:hypothetical protein
VPERGQPGRPGEHGDPGEPGKESGEGGRGGGGGEGGEGGEGTPKGPGGGGGPGGEGGRGAQGERGPAGPTGDTGDTGDQPKLRWAPAIGYVILALVLGFLIWRTQDLAHNNRQLITDVAALTRTQAEQGYQDCVTRNTRAEQSIKAFGNLVAAHTKDGNPAAARVWQTYLDTTRRVPLPP